MCMLFVVEVFVT